MEELGVRIIGAGNYSSKRADKRILRDIAYGYGIVTSLSRSDVGKTVVVKNKTIMAIESSEGVKSVIERGCHLSNGNGIVVKLHRGAGSNFDKVDKELIKFIIDNRGKVLAVEADKTFVEGLEECIEYSNANGFIFLAYTSEDLIPFMK